LSSPYFRNLVIIPSWAADGWEPHYSRFAIKALDLFPGLQSLRIDHWFLDDPATTEAIHSHASLRLVQCARNDLFSQPIESYQRARNFGKIICESSVHITDSSDHEDGSILIRSIKSISMKPWALLAVTVPFFQVIGGEGQTGDWADWTFAGLERMLLGNVCLPKPHLFSGFIDRHPHLHTIYAIQNNSEFQMFENLPWTSRFFRSLAERKVEWGGGWLSFLYVTFSQGTSGNIECTRIKAKIDTSGSYQGVCNLIRYIGEAFSFCEELDLQFSTPFVIDSASACMVRTFTFASV